MNDAGRPGRTAGLVGNDVVDYADPAALASYTMPRFVDRICTPAERVEVASCHARGARVSALFASKEAAYKVVIKLRPGAALAYRRFAVSARFDAVWYEGLRLSLRLLTGDRWVHAVAWLGCDEPLHAIDRVTIRADPSRAVRTLALETLARRMNLAIGDFAIVREERPGAWDGFGPPRLTIRGSNHPIDLSLSHDGRLVAFATPTPAGC